MNVSKGTIVFVILAALAAVPVAGATCTNASINGVYGVLSSGLNGSSQPAAGINRVVVDGAGNATGTAVKSIDGTIVTYNFTGTYVINANCTGTTTWTNQNNQTEHDDLYLNNGNHGAFLIQTDAVHVQSSTAIAAGTETCTDLAVKHPYSMQLTGTVTTTGQVAVSGQLSLNGTGSVKGVATLSLNGTIEDSLPVTGTYQINSDCTGTVQFTPKGLSAINLAVFVVNADKEMIAVETDSGTIVSGMLQK